MVTDGGLPVDPAWILAQRVGLAAHKAATSRSSGNPEAQDSSVGYLRKAFSPVRYIETELFDYPPSVLYLLSEGLATVPTDDLGVTLETVLQEARAAIQKLRGNESPNGAERRTWPSPLRVAHVLSFSILNADASPIRLLRLGRFMMAGEQWRTMAWKRAESELSVALNDPLQRIRAATTTTEKLRAATDLCVILQSAQSHLHYIDQLRNALYHQLLCWPLLVASVGGPYQHAISLPVAIDVHFGSDGQVATNEVRLVGDSGFWKSPQDRNRCLFHLNKAVWAAKNLWYRHGARDHQFRRRISQADVVFNVEIAKAIAGPVSIVWESAEAYFAQVVLSGFLARTVAGAKAISSAVTGGVGRTITLDSFPSDIPPRAFPPNDLLRERWLEVRPDTKEIIWKGPLSGPEADRHRKRLKSLRAPNKMSQRDA